MKWKVNNKMHGIQPLQYNFFWRLRPRQKQSHEIHNFKREKYHPGPKMYNKLGPTFEYIVLQIINKITKFIPATIIRKLLAPIIGMPTTVPTHQVFPLNNILSLIDELEMQKVPLGIGVCPCRIATGEYVSKGNGYNVTDLVIGDWGYHYIDHYQDSFKSITYKKARKYLMKFDRFGLVHTVFNPCPGRDMQGVICNCDHRVCVPLNFYNKVGLNSFHKSPYKIEYNSINCNGCKLCIPKCPVHARIWDDKKNKIKIDHNKCIGCGICKNCIQQANEIVLNGKIPFLVMPPY